eukprot:2285929-Rhodomonas_salina.1
MASRTCPCPATGGGTHAGSQGARERGREGGKEVSLRGPESRPAGDAAKASYSADNGLETADKSAKKRSLNS